MEMPNQVVYQTNADFMATYENLVKNGIPADLTEKGILQFYLDKIPFQLSPRGRLQVKWQSLEQKKRTLAKIKRLLIPKNGEDLRIVPLSQQVWLTYVPGMQPRIYWCNQSYKYKARTKLSRQARAYAKRSLHLLKAACAEFEEEKQPESLDEFFLNEMPFRRRFFGNPLLLAAEK